MKKLTIEIEFADQNSNVSRKSIDAKSEANMWNILREVRDQLTDQDLQGCVSARVFTEDGTLFKDIVFKTVKGKIQMVNLVKETCRRQVEKARKAAKEKAEKEAARKAKKREANRRYRARKKAQKETVTATVKTTEAGESVSQAA